MDYAAALRELSILSSAISLRAANGLSDEMLADVCRELATVAQVISDEAQKLVTVAA
jgi:hypothetical protein